MAAPVLTSFRRPCEMIIVPFVARKLEALELGCTFPALVFCDCFGGQTTVAINSLFEKHHIISVQIPASCTDKLQPIEKSINKPVREELKSRFQSWYATEVKKQIEHVPVHEVKVDVTATAIKARSCSWEIAAWQAIEKRPEIAINRFQKAGIIDAVSTARAHT